MPDKMPYTAHVYCVVDEASRTVKYVRKAEKPIRTYADQQSAWYGITRSIQTKSSPESRRIKLVYPDGRPDEWYMQHWVLRATGYWRSRSTNAWRLRLPVQCQPYTLVEEPQTMNNMTMKVDGNILTITVDLSAPTTPSSSGKTDIIASSQGNVDVPGNPGVKLGLNIYRAKK
jgi:hypothetical protein